MFDIRKAVLAAVTAAGLSAALPAAAQAPAPSAGVQDQHLVECPSRPYRWLEDCSNLATSDLNGLSRLRYMTWRGDQRFWLTLGGEARTRMDLLHDIDFGIGGQPGYTEISGRLLVHGDLRARAGPRAFVQLGIVQETGRKPGPRAQDESQVDVTQAFVDLPVQLGAARVVARLGRQETDLTGNRLLSTRDGSTLRRTFQGVKIDILAGGAKIALLDARPTELRDDAFADRPDPEETFRAVSVDLPRVAVPGGGTLNLFAFDRHRTDARWLHAQGREHRQTFGFHYAGQIDGWAVDVQPAWQRGRVQGLPVRAYGVAVQLDRDLGGPYRNAIGVSFVAASGDKGKTRRIETFDPTYPNNGGLSDAPLFYQTNYVFGGGDISAFWRGVTWTASGNLLVRHSLDDGVYANGRPVNAAFGHERLTSLLSQISARKTWRTRYEIYASLTHADALGAIAAVGGHDAFYSRVQLTARF